MIFLFQIIFFIVNFYIKINGNQKYLFFNPNKEFVKLNEKISICCRTKNLNMKDFIYKRNGNVMVYKCMSLYSLIKKVDCGYVGEWFYMNVTIPRVTWEYRGNYECIINKTSKKLFLNVTVPPKTDLRISHVLYKKEWDLKSENNDSVKLKGNGILTDPYDLRNSKIKSIEMTCSSNCSYPPPYYKWEITSLSGTSRSTSPLTAMNADNIPCKGKEEIDMSRSSSLIKVDCFEQKLSGLQYIECKAKTVQLDEEIVQRAYVFCQGEYVTKSNRSRLISKNVQLKVTTGEMINIIVGCSIGVVLLISGIILICKHRSKDDFDQYTMRQNSIDHSGYRV